MSTETWDSATITSRMGRPCDVASAVERQGTRALFALRHPIVTYVLTPIPLLVVLWVAYIAGLIGLANGFESYREAVWAVRLAELLCHGIAYVPPAVLTLVIAWVAIRSRTKVVWWLTAAGLVAVTAGMMAVSLRLPTTPGTGNLQVGLGFPPAASHWPQFLIPLALTALCMAWQVRSRKLES